MKKLMLTSILAALVALGTTGMAQDYPDEYLGLPGDNLNLYAVMKLFQESETLEGFERNLNAENSKINNLDLNGDNYIDYITVSDFPDGDDHTIVLRVALDRKEVQDVAVFTVQKFHNGTVQIQLIGDEALYGKNYIIEPNYEETPNPGYIGRPENRTNVTVVSTTPYEISYWPLIRYIYMPSYVGWHSSWYWGYYPEWWSPWRPYYWHYYYGYHYNFYNDYYSHYRHWDYYRWNRYNDFYYHGVRAHSPIIQVNITKNVYRNTYSRPEQRKEGEALYSRMHPEGSSRTAASRPASGVRTSERPETKGSQAAVRSTDGTRQPVTRSSAEQRPSASTRPEASTRPGNPGTDRQPATKSSTEQRPAASTTSNSSASSRSGNSQAPAQRSSATSASRPSAPSQKSSGTSASRSSAPSQRSSGTSASRSSATSQRSSATSASKSSGQSQRSSATRSSQPSRSSSSSSTSKSSSSKSSSNDSKSGRR